MGLRSNYVAAYYAAPHMMRQKSGLIVNISAAASMDDFYNVAYRTAKAATDRMTSALAHDLRPHDVAVVSLWPRWVRTERVLIAARGEHPNFPVGPDDLADADSPEFVGRAIAHLAADPNLMNRSAEFSWSSNWPTSKGLPTSTARCPISTPIPCSGPNA